MLTLQSSVSDLSGVGAQTQKLLVKLGIQSVDDLLHHIPQRYVDYSHILKTSQLSPGPVTVRGTFRSINQRRTRRGLMMTSAIIDDGHGGCEVVWFNQPFRKAELAKAGEVFLSGELAFHGNRLSIVSPEYEPVSELPAHTARIVPVYPLTKGITSKKLRLLIQKALSGIAAIDDFLPRHVAASHKLESYDYMVRMLHFPDSSAALEQAKHRWAFNELFDVMLAHQLTRKQLHSLRSPQLHMDKNQVASFVEELPFTLTDDQRLAAWEILKDIERPEPMNRLLQGDVGSGKTIVSALAIYQALRNEKQVAVVAPTEVVAKQHYETYSSYFKSEILLLTSSVTPAAKRRRKNMLASSEKKLAIGTHALLQKDVQFRDLGLVIIDEQHRFGVRQRQHLLKQKGAAPHVLSMTATPIPRTLALTLYSDLDVSTIKQLPPGRKQIETSVAGPGKRQKVYDAIEGELHNKHQIYVVCPLIDESDSLGVTSVTKEYERVQGYFKRWRVEVLHGQLSADDKARIIKEFSEGSIDILIATTVVEVGVNVPNATVMLIEGAERFGLSQLHQLRGRVGRAEHQAYCYALTSSAQQARKERLQAFESTTDGFELAQLDLDLRGPGAMYSTLQHGLKSFTYADIGDLNLIKQVKDTVKELMSSKDLLQYPRLQKRITKFREYYHLN